MPKMVLYYAIHGFWDEEWADCSYLTEPFEHPKEKLVRYFIAQGTVIALSEEKKPDPKRWAPVNG